MNPVNYQKEMEKILADHEKKEEVPSLFLHSCCAPCSSYVLEYLSRYFCITVFFYNPNIAPLEEYRRRAEEIRRFTQEIPAVYPITFIEGKYDPEHYYEAVRGLEREPERGKRCEVCFRLRLSESLKAAERLHMDYMTTTLTISPLKNAPLLNAIGEEMTGNSSVRWLPSDFKKKNGYQRSIELSDLYGLYRQDYCGCVFSKKQREDEKKAAQTAEKRGEDEEKNS